MQTPLRVVLPAFVVALVASAITTVASAREEYIYVDSLLPLPIVRTTPTFSMDAVKRCVSGHVLVHVDIDTAGTVRRATVARRFNRWNCPDSMLAEQIDSACVAAARRWRFERVSIRRRKDSCTVVLDFPDPDGAKKAFGALVGRITCLETTPAAYAVVEFVGSRHGTTTDPDGRYRVDTAPEGLWTVRIRPVDCSYVEKRVRIVAGRTDTLNFQIGKPGRYR